jgi:hypothetical protein
MKLLGIWLLSIVVWILLGECRANYLHNVENYTESEAASEGISLFLGGWLLTGIVTLGIWCIWFA